MKKLLSLSANIRLTVIVCAGMFACCSATSFAQWVSIPDSEYVARELIVWFQPGILNYEYFGCMEEGEITDPAEEFPIDIDFLRDQNFSEFLTANGATGMRQMFPRLLPCRDTLSIARRGNRKS